MKDPILQPSLFGGETPIHHTRTGKEGKYQHWKRINNYRKAESKRKCCGSCEYFMTIVRGNEYRKCMLMGASASSASDILVSALCDRWKAH